MIIVLGILVVPAMAFIILQNSMVQTYLANRIATTISENLEADFSIESMDMILFNRVVLKEVMLKDQYLDTLLYAPSMIATLKTFSPSSNRIELSRLKFKDATVRLSTDTTKTINLKFITQALKKPPDSTKVKWKVTIHNIDFEQSRFKYENHFKPKKPDFGVNFTDMDFADLDIEVRDLRVDSGTVHILIERLDFRDKSGCVMHDLSALMSLNKEFMKFEDLHIILDDSDIRADRLDFIFNSWKDFGNQGFSSKVKLDYNFLPSRINMADAAYWASFLHGIDKTVNLTGNLHGRLNSFKGDNILLEYGNNTFFSGNFDLNGLPDIQETFMYFDIQDLTTTVTDIESFQKPGEPGETVDLSEQLSQLGEITYHGKFAGFYNDFVSYGTLITDVGQLSTDLSIRPDSLENVHFNGKLKTEDFDLARLTDLGEIVGKLSMNAQVEGTSYQGGSLSARMDGDISKVGFNNYEYQHINFQGDLSNRKFDGSFSVRDPNLQMEFFGKLDINDTLPVFDFTANVDRARLFPLHLAVNPTYTLSCYLRANFFGSDIDEFDGEINLVNSLFQKEGKQIQIYNFNLYAQHRPDSNRMILKSDLVDAEIYGQYEFEDIGKATGWLLAHHLPAFRDVIKKNPDIDDESFNNFRYEFHLKNTYPITDFFFPEIGFARNSKIYGNYNPSTYEFNLEGDLSSFQYGENTWDNLDISLVSNDSTARFLATCESLVSGSVLNMENIKLSWNVDSDSVKYSLLWKNKNQEDISLGDISGFASFQYRPTYNIPRIDLHFNPGKIYIRDTIWDLNQSGVTIDTSSVEFHNLKLNHNLQSLAVNGKLSRHPSDELNFNFTDLDLEHLNLITGKFGLQLDGIMDGTTTISDIYNNPLFLSDISINQLFINNEELGNTFIRARWNNPEQKIRLEMEAMRGNLKTLDIKGDYFPDNRKINFNLAMDKLRLEIFEPYTRGVITDLNGLASGQLQVGGYTDKPMVNGALNMQKTSCRVEYLQTIYSFTNEITIRDNDLILDDFELFDETGNRAVAQGIIKNQYFRDFDFDLSLRADNFNFMETRAIHNQTFYGDAIGSGLIRFLGQPGDLRLVVSAKTEQDTHIFIPINQERDLQENNFITFIQPDSLVEEEEEEADPQYTVDLTGLRLLLDLEVTRDATVEIIFDPKVGDIMTANGSGNIQLTMNPPNDFEIFGEYIIENGDYLFTLQNIINKRLSVQRGGRLTWNGDPTEAVINMSAVYDTRAAPGVLVPEPTENLKKRMPVECLLNMEGNLLNPLLKFEIEMPTAEEETRNVVRNAISTEEELTKQFLSLLVINNFSAPSTVSGGSGNTGAGMAGVTASELLSNQLSNWLSQISNDFDIGVNYRPGDEISSDQVEVALSTQIFDDRVSIHTNVDVSDKSTNTNTNQRTNTIAGDFDVDVKLTDNGKFRLKAFNRYNYDQLYKTAPYTQGVGFLYREDFNSFGELGRRYFGGSKKKKKNKEKKNVSENTTGSK